jgi:pimeloyl-ACP methyl ester carboxylesterase
MPIDGARAMAEKIPGAQFAGIPSGGHMSPMENAAAANEAIGAFLKG